MQTFRGAVVEVRDPATTNPTGQRSPIAPHAIAVGAATWLLQCVGAERIGKF